MKRECEVLEVEEELLPSPQVTVWRSWWRTCGGLLAVVLCTAAAVCFTFNKAQSDQYGGNALKHTLRDHFSKVPFTTKAAAIHLSGGFNPAVSRQTLDWRVDVDQAFASGELKLEDGHIIIPRDGIYFVYSQVSFEIRCSPRSDITEEHISHSVWRYSTSYSGYMPLFSSSRTACAQASPRHQPLWYNSIYLGAAFHLQAGDRLRTDTTSELLPHVEKENGKTFFGVFAL